MVELPPGKLVIISGPSGAGKSTVVRELIQQSPIPLVVSVSATTRPARQGERDAEDYHFLDAETFQKMRDENAFLECKEVHGNWYGTIRSEVASGLSEGKWVVLEIDVQGMLAVVQQVPDAVSIFLHPGSLDELEKRLRQRGTESEDVVVRRLAVARRELAAKNHYKYEVINDEVPGAVARICEILTAERSTTDDA